MIYLHDATLYTPAEKIEHGALICSGDTIIALGQAQNLPCPTGAQSIDMNGLSLVPGFIDLQINGAFGMDFTTDPKTIWRVGGRLTRFGVTSFLPTIISSPVETIHHAQAVLQEGPPSGYHGSRVIGLHIEGPYLNPEKSGAHDPSYLRLPDPKEYQQWNRKTNISMVTLAPELPGAIEAIQTLSQNGVVVSAGHSNASFTQAVEGFRAGIRYGTHLFNAMPALDHRQPGLVGALLEDKRLIAGMILDGIHVHPAMVNLAWRILRADRTSLVTDAMEALGMEARTYQLAGRKVVVDGSSARLEDGRLAGSVLSLDQALRNLMAFTNCSLQEALLTVTQVPARLMSIETSIGRLTVGNKADFVLLSPDIKVAGVWINGQAIVTEGK